MYAIQAQVIVEGDWGRSSRQIPTFYLDENVQGILNEAEAVGIALRIIDPWSDRQVIATAVKL